MSKNHDSFARLLRKWLVAHDMQPKAAAPVLGASRMTVHNWLNGNLPPVTRIPWLAQAMCLNPVLLEAVIARDRRRMRRRALAQLSEEAVDGVSDGHGLSHNGANGTPDQAESTESICNVRHA